MADLVQVLNLLKEAVVDSSKLRMNIPKFQEAIWSSEIQFPSKGVEDILGDLAYDLDYFEADPRIRSEDKSFFGEEKALDEIRAALAAIDLETGKA
jgi:hypothetical protein